ncbi:hypothetical protein HF086_000600 [Spodoptera exigua]|uniref:Uncharacterized protein n=1 Tax=Spodoptera exigua TaxID=7107 RepID=A0A922MQH2_SPOEX|nr:hypothetical protein HF086_000600 [Spodoptera exigua]
MGCARRVGDAPVSGGRPARSIQYCATLGTLELEARFGAAPQYFRRSFNAFLGPLPVLNPEYSIMESL